MKINKKNVCRGNLINRKLFITLIFTCYGMAISGCFSGGTNPDVSANTGIVEKVFETIAITDNESDEYVTALALTNNTLWIGTEHYVYSTESVPVDDRFVKKQIDAVDNSKVNSIHVENNDVYIASFEGYSSYINNSWEKQPIGNSNEIIPVGNDLWSATNSGIEVLKSKSGGWHKFAVSSTTDFSPTKQMQAIGTDGKETLWVGTLFGLHKFDLAGHTNFMEQLASGNLKQEAIANNNFWKRLYGNFQSPMGGMIANEQGNCPLAGNNVQKIRYDRENKRYLFCTKNGLSILTNGQWKSFKGTGNHLVANSNGEMTREERKGNLDIPTSEIYDVLPFEGKLYMATRSGLAILKEKDNSFKLLTLENGLPSNDVTSLALDRTNRILFVGTASGIGLIKV